MARPSRHDLLNLTATDLQTKHSLPTLTALPFPLEDVRILDPDLLRMRDSFVMVVKLSDLLREGVNGRKIHTMFIDSAGICGAVGSRLRQPGHGNVIEINFGADSPDQHYANMRAYMWGKAKEWLLTGAIDADPRLECDLTGPGYVVDNKIRQARKRRRHEKARARFSRSRRCARFDLRADRRCSQGPRTGATSQASISVELTNVHSRNTDSSRTFSQLLNSGEHVSN